MIRRAADLDPLQEIFREFIENIKRLQNISCKAIQSDVEIAAEFIIRIIIL